MLGEAVVNQELFKILSVCKGGGYRYCRTEPPHPKRNKRGLYPLHRVVMENKLGRLLERFEIVHHIDEDKFNDSPNNLEIKTNSEHTGLHKRQSAPEKVLLKCVCGKEFQLKPHTYRLRAKRNSSGILFCSRSCGSQFTQTILNEARNGAS